IASVAFADSGIYRCAVLDDDQITVTSNPAELKVYEPVVVTTQPVSQTKWSGDSVVFSIVAEGGSGEYLYRWQKDGTNITNATSPTLTLRNLITGNAGDYRCRVRSVAYTAFSDEAALTVYQTALITEQPTDVTVNQGQNASFTVEAIGRAPMTFKWQKDGTDITGQTTTTLALSSVTPSDEADYRCIASNDGGNDTSETAHLSVKGPATVTTDPENDTAYTGGSASFSITASGTQPLSYRWQRNGVNISGATSRIYTDNSVAMSDAGMYRCIAANADGRDTSSEAELTVYQTVYIVEQPEPLSVDPGANASFTVTASGKSPIYYLWQKNGVDIPTATSPTYTINSVSASDVAMYRCKVSNGGGERISNEVLLSLNGPAVIVVNPEDTTQWTGRSISFQVTASGSTPIIYQWQKDGINVMGGTQRVLNVDNLTISDAGNYRCIAENQQGADTSDAAKLTVKESAKIITHPDSLDAFEGDTVSFSVVAAGEAPITYQWLKNGFEISNETLPALTLNRITSADVGKYQCIAVNDGGSDTSNIATLTVSGAGLSVNVPNGGETWNYGSQKEITWTVHGIPDSVKNVKIEFSTTGGSSWQMIIDSTPNTGKYLWQLPTVISEFCKVRISDALDDFPADESDSLFTIKKIVAIQDHEDKPVIPLFDNFVASPNPAVKYRDKEIQFLFTPNKDIDGVKLKVFDALGNLLYEYDNINVIRCSAGTQ
ncbi:immunoglobulin domain-containing protein, partial [Fibrobacterota bacterium]